MYNEDIYVKQVYEEIAHEFSNTRVCLWNFVKQFLENKENLYGLDVGCGNGKNMIHSDTMVGIDNCAKLLDICKKSKKHVVYSDSCALPFKNETFDYVMSISMIHHLSTNERRELAFMEMIRVLKPGGQGLINVWSFENQEKRKFVKGDNLVPWKNDKQRYYHIMSKDMFMDFVNSFLTHICIDSIHNEKGNWILRFTKKYTTTY